MRIYLWNTEVNQYRYYKKKKKKKNVGPSSDIRKLNAFIENKKKKNFYNFHTFIRHNFPRKNLIVPVKAVPKKFL